MDRRDFIKAAGIALGGYAVGQGCAASEYADVPGWSEKVQMGRTKNGLATLVSGALGQSLHGSSTIDVTVNKALWPDSYVTGMTEEDYVRTHTDLWLTSATYEAERNKGVMEGEVRKSELDWAVEQQLTEKDGRSHYLVGRFGPKWDAALDIVAQDYDIEGVFQRSGPQFDWHIQGSYDDDGNVTVEIDDVSTLGITLEGSITPNYS